MNRYLPIRSTLERLTVVRRLLQRRRTVRSRRVPLALLCTFVAFGCASAPAKQLERLRPPVIRESFTPLPCPRSRAARGTTIGAIGCAERRILRTDRAINRRAKTIFGLLRDTPAKRRFLAAEKAWLAYRKASCTSVADVYRGGSAQPLAFATCVGSRNVKHLSELASFERLLRRTR
jgi:uncharacterized protein YecT (DUF1311 family)